MSLPWQDQTATLILRPDRPEDERGVPRLEDLGDHDLMRILAAGHHDALDVLVRRHQRTALELAYRFLARWDMAEDVCQDAFLRVFDAAPTYQPKARFSTWLYRIVANLCWDRRRRAAKLPETLSDDHTHDPADHPASNIEAAERQQRVRRAIAQLPDRQRLALILHRYSGLSHKEIAESTGWTLGAVESCLVRAYRTLKTQLADLENQ